MDTTTCPTCGLVALVLDRPVLESTHGPTEHIRLTCINGHHYLMPTALARAHTRMTHG